jgi:uncharacterized protein (TIGR00725 family)
MGSGTESHGERAREVGSWLARAGFHLLTGGGGGVMSAVSESFFRVPRREGLVIGVIPGAGDDSHCRPRGGYPNPWVEIPIFTHLYLSGERGAEPMSRNHINVLSSDALIALPGGHGTASEVVLALAYGRPLVAYLDERHQIPGLPEETRVETDFAEVRRFVITRLGGASRAVEERRRVDVVGDDEG